MAQPSRAKPRTARWAAVAALASPPVVAGVKAAGGNAQLSVPLLFQHIFPSWFAGIGYAAIVIGALVPAAIMSIAAANLFTRNIYREFFARDASPAHETRVAQAVSLIVKAGAGLRAGAEQDVLD
jgi:solute:Na+ symporter, SSS family